jgi:hypothetical protein
MFTKTLVAALVLACVSVSLTKAHAGSTVPQYQSSQESAWMERASRNFDGPGN